MDCSSPSHNAILEQLPQVCDALEIVANDTSNGKIAAEADGILKQVNTFEFVFNLKLLINWSSN